MARKRVWCWAGPCRGLLFCLPFLCSVPSETCCLEGLLTAPSAHPAHGEGVGGCSVLLSIPAWLSCWHSWDLCSIAALSVAVGGLGNGVSPALLHARFGSFCGPSEFLCSLWDPCDSLCCLEHPNCGVWGISLQGQHIPHLHLCCCVLAAAARSPLGEVSLHRHCWCQQHRLMSDVNGSEREQMDFLGLRDQHPPGWLRMGAPASLPCRRRLQWMS